MGRYRLEFLMVKFVFKFKACCLGFTDRKTLYVGSAGSKGGLKLITNLGTPQLDVIEILQGKKSPYKKTPYKKKQKSPYKIHPNKN
jgi:hypothetical protein